MEEEQSLTWETASPTPRSKNELLDCPQTQDWGSSQPDHTLAKPLNHANLFLSASVLSLFKLKAHVSSQKRLSGSLSCVCSWCAHPLHLSLLQLLPSPLIDRSIHRDRWPRLSWWGPDLLRLFPDSDYRENKARMTFWKDIFRRPEGTLRI